MSDRNVLVFFELSNHWLSLNSSPVYSEGTKHHSGRMGMKLRHCKSNTLCEMLLQTRLLISDKFNRGSINNIGFGAIVHFGQHFLLK